MATIDIKVCDLCGYEVRADSPQNKLLENPIYEAKLSLGQFSGCNNVIFSGDLCTNCARAIDKVVSSKVGEMKTKFCQISAFVDKIVDPGAEVPECK